MTELLSYWLNLQHNVVIIIIIFFLQLYPMSQDFTLELCVMNTSQLLLHQILFHVCKTDWIQTTIFKRIGFKRELVVEVQQATFSQKFDRIPSNVLWYILLTSRVDSTPSMSSTSVKPSMLWLVLCLLRLLSCGVHSRWTHHSIPFTTPPVNGIDSQMLKCLDVYLMITFLSFIKSVH